MTRRPGLDVPAPVRVLMVMEATIGGTKRHLLELATGLHKLGCEVSIACPRIRNESHGDTSFWDDASGAGIPVIELPMERGVWSPTNLVAVRHLAVLLRRHRYDVVHAHSSIGGAVTRIAAQIVPRSMRPKVVYTPHGFAFLAGSAVRRNMFRLIERLLGLVTDRMIAVSPTEADVAVEHGVVPRDRVVAIPNGIDPSVMPRPEHRDDVRAREGWGDAPVVMTVARMTPQKDPGTWLRVAARIAAACADVRFVWVWGGDQQEMVKAEATRLGLGGRIDFLGYREDARELVSASTVFLLTSRFEGLPYVLVEALAMQVPVVATDVTGTRDVVRHGVTGLLAPVEDVEALAAHVLSILDDRERGVAIGLAGKRDVEDRFSIAQMVSHTLETYRDVLRQGSNRR